MFDVFPDGESAGVEAAAYPQLVDAVERGRVAPRPDPATGAAILDALGAEAALARAQSERLSAPVFEVEPLLREAEAVRAGPPAPVVSPAADLTPAPASTP